MGGGEAGGGQAPPDQAVASPWFPIAMTVLGGGLAGAGATGSPASAIGGNLFQQGLLAMLAQHYAEPQRRRQEGQKKEQDAWTAAQELVKSGQFRWTKPSETAVRGGTFGGFNWGIIPTEAFDVRSVAAEAAKLYPEAFAGFTPSGNDAHDLKQIEIRTQFAERERQRGYSEALGGGFEALGRPQPLTTPAQPGTGMPGPALLAPSGEEGPAASLPFESISRQMPALLDPRMAKLFALVARMAPPEGQVALIRELDAIQKRMTPEQQLAWLQTVTQGLPAGGRGGYQTSFGLTPGQPPTAHLAPTPPAEQRLQQHVAATKQRAAEDLKGKDFQTALASIPDVNARNSALKRMQYAAEEGDATAYFQAWDATIPPAERGSLSEEERRRVLTDKDYARRYWRRKSGLEAETERIIRNIERDTIALSGAPSHKEEEGRLIVNEQRAALEQGLGSWYRRLLQIDPEEFGEEAIHKLYQLRQITQDQKNQFLAEFFKKYPSAQPGAKAPPAGQPRGE